MIIDPKSKAEFKGSAEYAELDSHRIEMMKFYASPAFKAQQSFFDAELARLSQIALTTGRTSEDRETARQMYNAYRLMVNLPDFIGGLFTDEVPATDEKS